MRNYKFYILPLSLFVISAITACIKDNPAEQEEQYIQEIPVELQLKFSISGTDGQTRNVVDGILPGQSDENRITSLTVFVIDLDQSDNLIWNSVKYSTLPKTTAPNQINVNIKTRTGKKYIYAGANMSPAQRESFCANQGVYTSSGTTYHETIGDFVDLTGRGIVMFGQVVMESNSNPVIEITGPSDSTNPIETKLELSRVVSKVALTYTPETPGNDGYMKIHNDINGFIKSEDVYFMLNITNKSIRFTEINTPNYVMSDYLSYNTDTNHHTLYYYLKDPTNNFMFYTPEEEVYGAGDSDFFPTKKMILPVDINPGDDNPYHKGLDKYDYTELKHYNSSLYCLENTVNTTGFAPVEIGPVRHGINTQIIAAAKFTPGIINHYQEKTDGSGTYEIKEIIITSSPGDAGIMNSITGGDPNGPGTFYAVFELEGTGGSPNLYTYYTHAAKQYLEANPPGGNIMHFITYTGGYGYYATFISQPVSPLSDEDYDLERNHYYILNVTEMRPPGAVYPQQIYMLVNSETNEWISKKEIIVPID